MVYLLRIIPVIFAFIKVGGNIFSTAWLKAVKQTLFEQEIEDMNSMYKVDNHLVRRLIVMPLTEAFNPNQASALHGKVQYGDKCSLPASLGRLIFEKPYEHPWIFEIVPVKSDMTFGDFVTVEDADEETETDDLTVAKAPVRKLSKAYISPLDFRSPENYIFIPKWLMNTLHLKTNDLVDVSFVRIKLASLVSIQPLSIKWDKLINDNVDPKTLLEHEVNKYSSLTAGSTIAIEIGGVEYPLYVESTIGENGVALKGVRVQDADVRFDINRSLLEALIAKSKKRKERLAQEAENGKGGKTIA